MEVVVHIKTGVVHWASESYLGRFEVLDRALIKGLDSWSVLHLSALMTLMVIEVVIGCHVWTDGDDVDRDGQFSGWED
jgi:hypothetical protein